MPFEPLNCAWQVHGTPIHEFASHEKQSTKADISVDSRKHRQIFSTRQSQADDRIYLRNCIAEATSIFSFIRVVTACANYRRPTTPRSQIVAARVGFTKRASIETDCREGSSPHSTHTKNSL